MAQAPPNSNYRFHSPVPKTLNPSFSSPCEALMDVHHGSDMSGGGGPRSSSRLKRKPFADLTNTPSSTLLKPKPRPTADPKPADPEPAFASTSGRQENDGDLATSSSTPRKNIANNDELNNSTVSRQPVKGRRKEKEKTVEAGASLSCPPVEQNRIIEGNISLKDRLNSLHKAFSAPHERLKKKKQHHGAPVKIEKPLLPPDFIEKQRKYFALVDAFELPEEEVSDSELE